MACNPCFCGCALQTATKVIAVIYMVCAGFAIVYYGISTLALFALLATHEAASGGSNDDRLPKELVGVFIAIGFIYMLVYVAYFIIAVALILGANRYDLAKCRIWFIGIIVLIIVDVLIILAIMILLSLSGLPGLGLLFSIFPLIEVFFNVFCVFVVFAFMEEIKSGNPSGRNQNMGVVYSSPTAMA